MITRISFVRTSNGPYAVHIEVSLFVYTGQQGDTGEKVMAMEAGNLKRSCVVLGAIVFNVLVWLTATLPHLVV